MLRLQRQIDVMKQQIGGGVSNSAVDNAKYSQTQAQLQEAEQRYGEKHPTVLKLKRQLEDIAASMQAAKPMALTAPQGPPDNPMYIQFQGQLADADSQISGIEGRSVALEQNVEELQKRILQTPAIEAEYNSLRDQHTVALQRYQSFKDKEADAEVAQNMEQQSKGETFSVIEPPQYPDVPEKPNRQLLTVIGVFLTFVMAAGAMLAVDMLDPRIYEAKSLLQTFGEMPLVTVPYINGTDERRGGKMRWAGAAGAIAIVLAGLLVLAYQRLPLG